MNNSTNLLVHKSIDFFNNMSINLTKQKLLHGVRSKTQQEYLPPAHTIIKTQLIETPSDLRNTSSKIVCFNLVHSSTSNITEKRRDKLIEFYTRHKKHFNYITDTNYPIPNTPTIVAYIIEVFYSDDPTIDDTITVLPLISSASSIDKTKTLRDSNNQPTYMTVRWYYTKNWYFARLD